MGFKNLIKQSFEKFKRGVKKYVLVPIAIGAVALSFTACTNNDSTALAISDEIRSTFRATVENTVAQKIGFTGIEDAGYNSENLGIELENIIPMSENGKNILVTISTTTYENNTHKHKIKFQDVKDNQDKSIIKQIATKIKDWAAEENENEKINILKDISSLLNNIITKNKIISHELLNSLVVDENNKALVDELFNKSINRDATKTLNSVLLSSAKTSTAKNGKTIYAFDLIITAEDGSISIMKATATNKKISETIKDASNAIANPANKNKTVREILSDSDLFVDIVLVASTETFLVKTEPIQKDDDLVDNGVNNGLDEKPGQASPTASSTAKIKSNIGPSI